MFVKRGILDFFDKRIQEETFDRPKLDGVASNKLEGGEGEDNALLFECFSEMEIKRTGVGI